MKWSPVVCVQRHKECVQRRSGVGRRARFAGSGQSGEGLVSSFGGASFDASNPPVSHIDDAPLAKSEGKRAAKPDRTSSREEFISSSRK